MISIEQIRNNPVYIKERLSFKGDNNSIDSILVLDKSYRSYISKSNELRAKRNQVSDKIAETKKLGKNADNDIKAMREVGNEIKALEDKANELKIELNELLLRLPNLPHESVPEGKDNTKNKNDTQFLYSASIRTVAETKCVCSSNVFTKRCLICFFIISKMN